MAFILRWLAILALLALVLLCAIGALGAAGVITGYDVPASGVAQVDTQIAAAQSAADRNAASAGWIDVGLLGAATLFFLISAIRLMRRTQGFWTWLLALLAMADAGRGRSSRTATRWPRCRAST